MGQAKSATYSVVLTQGLPAEPVNKGLCKESGCRANRLYKDGPYCYFHACKYDPALNEERLRKGAETRAKKKAEWEAWIKSPEYVVQQEKDRMKKHFDEQRKIARDIYEIRARVGLYNPVNY